VVVVFVHLGNWVALLLLFSFVIVFFNHMSEIEMVDVGFYDVFGGERNLFEGNRIHFMVRVVVGQVHILHFQLGLLERLHFLYFHLVEKLSRRIKLSIFFFLFLFIVDYTRLWICDLISVIAVVALIQIVINGVLVFIARMWSYTFVIISM